jgi:hypothetical protein
MCTAGNLGGCDDRWYCGVGSPRLAKGQGGGGLGLPGAVLGRAAWPMLLGVQRGCVLLLGGAACVLLLPGAASMLPPGGAPCSLLYRAWRCQEAPCSASGAKLHRVWGLQGATFWERPFFAGLFRALFLLKLCLLTQTVLINSALQQTLCANAAHFFAPPFLKSRMPRNMVARCWVGIHGFRNLVKVLTAQAFWGFASLHPRSTTLDCTAFCFCGGVFLGTSDSCPACRRYINIERRWWHLTNADPYHLFSGPDIIELGICRMASRAVCTWGPSPG